MVPVNEEFTVGLAGITGTAVSAEAAPTASVGPDFQIADPAVFSAVIFNRRYPPASARVGSYEASVALEIFVHELV
jgi:hypothetical protein